MRTPILFAAATALATPLAAQAQQDRMLSVPATDPEMNAAIARAQRELPVFFGHVGAPGPGETGFAIKYDLIPGPGTEYIWAEIISHRNGQTVAKLTNEPNDKRFKLGQMVTLNDDQIVDWGYRRDGVMQGSYTMRVMLKRVSEAEAAPIRKYLGW